MEEVSMELDDIKKGWEELNQKLERTQIINRTQIKEMIVQRSKTAQERLYKMFLLIAIVIPALMVIFPLMYQEIGIGRQLLLNIVTEVLFVYALFTQLKLLIYVRKMNILHQNVSGMMYYTLMFRKWFKIRVITGMPAASIFLLLYFFEIHESTDILSQKEFWITLAIFIPVTACVCFLKIRSTFSSLKTIEKAVQDLKELKEE
jgi:hypothetical protein